MKKRPTPKKEAKRPDTANFTTSNPRHLRALAALMRRALPREQLDREAGCSNGPELVAELRRRGLELPCVRIDAYDRDGKPCRPGVYHLTEKDRRILHVWLRRRQQGGIAPELAVALVTLAPFAFLAALSVLRLLDLV